MSLTARLAIGLRCFTDYCFKLELRHPEIDAFLDCLWRFPLTMSSPDSFAAWENTQPHLVDVGLGDEFSADFLSFLHGVGVSDTDFRHVVESLIEIVFSSLYGGAQNEQSLDFLHSVIAATALFDVWPPPPNLFSTSLFVDNHGWGKPLSNDECNRWRTLNY